MEFPIKSGVLITVLLILPNLVWMLLPKKPAAPKASAPIALTISEWVSRIAVFIIPLFYTIELSKKFTAFAIAIMSLAIVIYYAAWVRYFIRGRTAKLFRTPFFRNPVTHGNSSGCIFNFVFLYTGFMADVSGINLFRRISCLDILPIFMTS
jgi:hypothetical protein